MENKIITSSRKAGMQDINAFLSPRIKILGDDEKCGGFTLMEVLIVVLIIGILAAVAVPQYQKAVLKSRFSSIMPSTKAVRDGNEAYYMEHGAYANTLSDLDVTLTNNEMTVTPNPGLDYAYVKATRSDIADKANLIMYQKHSVQYPGEIHCEAKGTQAEWLCKDGLHAVEELNEVITPGFKTFVLEGTGNGLTPAQLAAAQGPNCDTAYAAGASTCVVHEATADTPKQKEACYGTESGNNVCVYTTFDENNEQTKRVVCSESQNFCNEIEIKDGKEVNGFCQDDDVNSDGKGCNKYSHITETYTQDGKEIKGRCQYDGVSADGKNCRWYVELSETYTQDGKEMTADCGKINWSSGGKSCSSYFSITETYTQEGKKITGKCLSDTDQMSSDGKSCSKYYPNGSLYETYTQDGKEITGSCFKANWSPDGKSCSKYSSITETYTQDGKEIERSCYGNNMSSDGKTCSAYNQIKETYTLDGKQVTGYCEEGSGISSDGKSCASYNFMYKYTNDEYRSMEYAEGYYYDEDEGWQLDEIIFNMD